MTSLLKRAGHAAGWTAAIILTVGLTWALTAESWSDRWGATHDEVAAALPGDELIEDTAVTTTRAVTVQVPPAEVWPWVAQFGQGRGGLYSYDWLERLFGIEMRSTNTILPEEQDVAVGDQIWVTQPGYPADLGHVVADVESGESLVLALSTPTKPFAEEDAPWTWAFVLQPGPDDTTRLVVRNRNARLGGVADAVWDRVVGPIGFAMERKTMLGIADRAEAAAGVDTGWRHRETVWFGAQLVTGVAVLLILATRTPLRRKASYAIGLTAAATVVLFRLPSAALAVALAGFASLVTILLWRAWPPRSGRKKLTQRTVAPPAKQLARV